MKKHMLIGLGSVLLTAGTSLPSYAIDCPKLLDVATYREVIDIMQKSPRDPETGEVTFRYDNASWTTGGGFLDVLSVGSVELKSESTDREIHTLKCNYTFEVDHGRGKSTEEVFLTTPL